MTFKRTFLALVFLACIAATAQAQVGAKMFRQPDVSATPIIFVYAADIWVVPKEGGLPDKLPIACGESGTLSHDEKYLAFTTKTEAFRRT